MARKALRERAIPLPVFEIGLLDVILDSVKTERFPDHPLEIDNPEPAFETSINLEVEPPQRLTCFLRVSIQYPSESAPAVKIDFVIVGLFLSDEDLTEDDLKYFGEKNALLILWPYARQIAQELSSHMRLPIPPLPTLDVARTIETMESVKQEETNG